MGSTEENKLGQEKQQLVVSDETQWEYCYSANEVACPPIQYRPLCVIFCSYCLQHTYFLQSVV